jgi:hypothetical protein
MWSSRGDFSVGLGVGDHSKDHHSLEAQCYIHRGPAAKLKNGIVVDVISHRTTEKPKCGWLKLHEGFESRETMRPSAADI